MSEAARFPLCGKEPKALAPRRVGEPLVDGDELEGGGPMFTGHERRGELVRISRAQRVNPEQSLGLVTYLRRGRDLDPLIGE